MKNICENTRYVGFNIGSVSVNMVIFNGFEILAHKKVPHLGNPQKVISDLIYDFQIDKDVYFELSGQFGEISEIQAIETGLLHLDQQYNAVLSLGGETFGLYLLDDNNQIINVLAQDKCAAGSGEFFLQQIERLNLSLPIAIEKAKQGHYIQLASRCSVHCKSDVTHKLNKEEASVEDILYSLIINMVNKINALIYQSRLNLQHVLVIGGLSLNTALTDALEEQINGITFHYHTCSSVFEAFGTALIAYKHPQCKKLQLKSHRSFTSLPNLSKYQEKVSILKPPQKDKKSPDLSMQYVLGIDVGSTTTKAVLLNPQTDQILASHYRRTNGNPIQATKKCLRNIYQQIGDIQLALVGVTGSGRQIVGAYLGTPAVYNEISAHSSGAAYFDPDVDTIFEIGGQDAKYMFLQNQVPVDYAMNASCSAGTGSFLEESAKCDLGVTVEGICNVALQAKSPVRFKADCAAFINSDIRTALQEGYEKENIIGGLVYSIANNYLNKVKGSRPIGQKIFLQGGVAKNYAVGYAFAQATDRQIIIPPFPELMGAFGIALIAKEKHLLGEIKVYPSNINILSLIDKEMQHIGEFTCKACANYCNIEQYQVGDRKFPFGGKCSRYENVRIGNGAISEKEDYVSWRNQLMYPDLNSLDPSNTHANYPLIGIPRALLTHSLYPLFSKFFALLGFKVVLSDIDSDLHLIPNAPFCYPIQIFHGAINNLVKQGIKVIFIPHIYKLKKPDGWLNSTFCPITQSSSYMVSPIFEDVNFLVPELNFSEGYRNDLSLVNMMCKKFSIRYDQAIEAYETAIEFQTKIENQLYAKGKDIIEKLKNSDEIGIIIVGRSYNVFPPETSQSIPKKLISMGINVLPFEFIEPHSESNFPWYFANYVKEALNLVKKHENLFLLYINNFSCTIDAFIQNHVRSEMQAKPYLFLELDAHVADAGTQTRLEAFIEIINNYRSVRIQSSQSHFQLTRVIENNGRPMVQNSTGENIDLKNPRVKIYLPCFSHYHTDILEKFLEYFGFHVGRAGDIQIEYPLEGLKYCSGKECIPLPIVIGHIMELVKKRQPGEIIGYFMIRGGSPCVVHNYNQYIEEFLLKNHIKDVFLFNFDKRNNFMGTRTLDFIQYAPKLVILGDIISEIDSSLRVVGNKKSYLLFRQYWAEFLEKLWDIKNLKPLIDSLIKRLQNLPRKGDPRKYPKVILSGDFFVRYSAFFLKNLRDEYNKQGIIVKSTDLFELFLYGIPFGNMVSPKVRDKYVRKIRKKIKGDFRFYKDFSMGFYLSQFIFKYMQRIDRKLRQKFEKTGLLYSEPTDIMNIVKKAEPLINPVIFGEAVLTVGKGMEVVDEQTYDSLVLVGPQYCLPYRISQAILKPIFLENKFPLLVFDAEISAISPNMKRLILANIQQIKRHHGFKSIILKEKHSMQYSADS